MPFVNNHGVKIYYEDEGSGPPIVFHMGAGGDSSVWRHAGYMEGLPGFRKILVDQRGRGRSDRPSTVESHRMEHYVQDLRVVLDDVSVDRTAFWGYSAGILVGIAFGGAFPQKLGAMVGTGGLRWRDLTDLPRVDESAEIAKDVAQGGVRHELDARMSLEGDRFPEAIDRNVREGDPLMHALDGVAWMDWRGPKSVLANFSAPILIFTGEKEDPGRETENTVAHLRNARMVRVPGVGHLGAFSRSELVLPQATQFLREHLGGP
jgi:pimeloyl-ACP methyl ester carboxylesterase